MSVEPSESLSEVWTRWQGQVVNGSFPLGRCLGSSDHSGVFLTTSAARDPAEVAIKLVPTNRSLAESLLPRWKRAGGVTHPRLLPLFQWGGCQLEGLPYLYVLMEYADQTLAQLLQHRALTEDEAREMLPPMLDALGFLHSRDLVQGQLKPANILVVGDQLKLSSDTVRRLSEGILSTHAPGAYDPPEIRQGATSPASDIWALGVTLFEALTRRVPAPSGDSSEAIALPADFSPAFRDIVERCLSPNAQDRPTVAELLALAGGRPAESAGSAAADLVAQPERVTSDSPTPGVPEASVPEAPESQPPAPKIPELATLAAVAFEPATTIGQSVSAPAPPPARDDAESAPLPLDEPPRARALLTVMVLGALVVVAVLWAGIRWLSPHRPTAAVATPGATLVQPPAAPAAAEAALPAAASSATNPARSEAASPAVHEVIPDVPPSARRTIRGHIKVWVRVMVNQDGSVFAAVPDRSGPSRYFQRLALDAAKKWTFPPADTPSQRLVQIHFDFSREGTTGRAVTLR